MCVPGKGVLGGVESTLGGVESTLEENCCGRRELLWKEENCCGKKENCFGKNRTVVERRPFGGSEELLAGIAEGGKKK